MCKTIKNNILCVLILIIAVLFSSCDGRDKRYKTSKQFLAKNGLVTKSNTHIKYIPEHYSETVTDTILDTGFKVHIKTYVDMDTYSLTKPTSILNSKIIYRNTNADLKVSINNQSIFNKTITTAFIHNTITNLPEYFKTYILKSIWIDDSYIDTKQAIVFNLFCIKPDDPTAQQSFLLTIFKDGNYNITETATKI